ncbi:hypothetical protein P152DRAFT_206068 [Eremomyces bilateralis CBS 781.70]|uniref:Uncharacterized protein n=1 Tax=Eremomyces bilateralis CBS 781.70 TaxID=1392243 RepID=A0A6G1FT02_9PEZI|nr:uncharacterized protein P152DRAFT_206068 [Eremomyces bilateralis CBS 781.70]KAF1808856.1 hypothetical protein P152DRAFT_206068 [Eremomyces bilateralis CBS 781.70]
MSTTYLAARDDVRDPNNPKCYTNSRGDYKCDKNSAWWSWGRWLIFGIIAALVIIAILVILRLYARRRIRRGQQPIAGTAWIAGNPKNAPPKDIASSIESGSRQGTGYGNSPYGQSTYGNQGPPEYPLQGRN